MRRSGTALLSVKCVDVFSTGYCRSMVESEPKRVMIRAMSADPTSGLTFFNESFSEKLNESACIHRVQTRGYVRSWPAADPVLRSR